MPQSRPATADPEVDALLAQADAFLAKAPAPPTADPEVDALLSQADDFLAARDAPAGRRTAGNIDLSVRPRVPNADGSTSTVRSMSIGTDQGEVLIPTVIDGRLVTDDEAIAHYKRTGQHLGIFDNPRDATAYAESLHRREASGQGSRPAPPAHTIGPRGPLDPAPPTGPHSIGPAPDTLSDAVGRHVRTAAGVLANPLGAVREVVKPYVQPLLPAVAIDADQAAARRGATDNQFVEGAISGVSSTVGGVGGALQAARTAGYFGPGDTFATNPIGAAVSKGAAAMSAADAAVQAAFPTPESIAGDIMKRPQLLADPAWWQRGAGQVLGSALPYLASPAAGGSLAPGILEAVTEGGNTYNDAIAAGKTPEQAATAAAGVTAANLVIVPGFNKVGEIVPGGKLAQMGVEALQEASQEVPQNVAAGRPIGEGVANAAVVGGFGAGFMPHEGHTAPATRGTGIAPARQPIQVVRDPALPPPVPRRAEQTPPAAATRPGQGPIPGPPAPGPLPPAPAAPGPPDSLRQAIERELGGAVTLEQVDELAAKAFVAMGGEADLSRTSNREEKPEAPAPGTRIKAAGTDQAPTQGRPKPYDPRGATGVQIDEAPTAEAGPKDERPWIERVAQEAVDAGAYPDLDEAMDEIERRGRSLHEATEGQAANEGDDRALLEHIANVGGVLITDKDLAGEMRMLREALDPTKVNTFAGVRNVLRRKKKPLSAAQQAYLRSKGRKVPTSAGLAPDSVIEAINEDPRFQSRGMATPNDLLEFLTKAMVDHREGRNQRQAFDPQHYGEGAGVRLGRRWYRSEGPMVRRSENLSPEADAIQERFARSIEDDVEGYVARYKEKFGNVIDADKVKELAGVDLKTHHEAVHAPSSWLADELYDRAVSDPALDRGLVVFTGGGPGSGKSSSVERSALKGIAAAAVIQRDSAFANPERAREMLQAARDNGHTPTLFYVYTDPVVAWQRQAGRDRTVSLDKFLKLHRDAIQTARMMAPELGEDLFILDNSGAAPALLEDRPAVDIIEDLAQNYPSNAEIRARIAASPAPEAGAAPARGSEAPAADTGGSHGGEPDRGEPPGSREAPAPVTPGTRIKAAAPKPSGGWVIRDPETGLYWNNAKGRSKAGWKATTENAVGWDTPEGAHSAAKSFGISQAIEPVGVDENSTPIEKPAPAAAAPKPAGTRIKAARTEADVQAERPLHPSVSPELGAHLRRIWPNMPPERMVHEAPGVIGFLPDSNPLIGGAHYRVTITDEGVDVTSTKKRDNQLINFKRATTKTALKSKQHGAPFRAAVMAPPLKLATEPAPKVEQPPAKPAAPAKQAGVFERGDVVTWWDGDRATVLTTGPFGVRVKFDDAEKNGRNGFQDVSVDSLTHVELMSKPAPKAEPPPAKVDTLDTGEQQPRLPGEVGNVREQNVKPVEFEAPFTLSGGIAKRKEAKNDVLFESTGERKGTRIKAAAAVDEDAPALPVTSDEEGSPTRRAFSEPPPVPPHVKPPRKPLSEMQVVARLAQVFGHERRAGVFRRLQGKIPVPIASGVFGRPAYGYYTIRGQIIRLKKFGDLTTFVHELGHDIDYRIFTAEQPGWKALQKQDKGIKQELMALGANTSPPSATPAYQRSEGVAEFFRVWFVDPDLAKRQAPKFTAAFDQILAANPELASQFEEGRILVQQYLAQGHEQRGMARIDFGTKSDDDPSGANTWQKVQALMVDDLVALEDAVQHLAADKPIDITENAHTLARLARGAAAKAGGFLLHGVREADGTFVGGSLKAALAGVKDDLHHFSAYLVARRSVELRARNIEPGMKAKEAQAILDRYGSQAFQDAAAAVYEFQDNVLGYAVANGLLTPAQHTQIRALNQDYVPYWRVMKPDGQIGARRVANRPSLIKRIRGSGRDVVDPLQAIVRNTHALVEAVEQHRAMTAFVKQTQASKGGDLFLEKIRTPQEKTTFNLATLTRDIKDALEQSGIDVSTAINGKTGEPMLLINDEPVDLNELVSVFTPATMATGKDRVITVMHEGTRTFYRVTDPALFEALTAIGPKATNEATRWAFKVLGAPARVLRAGATLTFGFVGRNVVRDSWVAAIQSKHGFRPGIDTLRGLYSYLRADEQYQQFLNSGAGNAAMVSQDRKAIVRELRELASRGRLRDHAATVVFHPLDFMRALSEASEHSTRVGEFIRARDKGASLTEAALAARDVTVDFARGGSFTKSANQFVAFFNARIQGYARFAETFRDNPVGASIRTATTVTLLSLALWALNKDDDEYAELPEWEKNTYWHIPIHWLPTLVGGEKGQAHAGFLRIPKPFELGTIFGTVFERALDQITERDPNAWKRLFVDDPSASAAEVTADAAKQGAWSAVSSMVPTSLLPMLEAAMNYSTFRQRPIVSPFDKDLPAELQYNRWTSETAKTIGRVLDMPPAIIDHLVYSYGAGLARGVVSEAIDPALRMIGGRDQAIAPARSAQSLPGVGAFVRDAAGTDAMSIAELYALRDRLRAVPSTVKRYEAEGSHDKAEAFANRYPNRLAEQRRVNAAAETIKDLRDRVSSIYASKTLSPGAKREQLDRALEGMVNAARKGLGKPPLPSRF